LYEEAQHEDSSKYFFLRSTKESQSYVAQNNKRTNNCTCKL